MLHITINGAVSKTGEVRKSAIDGRTTHHDARIGWKA